MTLELQFRQIIKSDLKILGLFFERNNLDAITANFDPFPLSVRSAKQICSEGRKDRFFLAFVNDVVVGFAMLRGFDEGYNVPSFGILVDNEFQGRGIGKAFLRYVLADAKKMGCQRVRLSAYSDNSHALSLYDAAGFVVSEIKAIENSEVKKIILFKEL